MSDFLTVTELAGDDVTREQVERICHRYYWAGKYCLDKDVLEVACGTGQGLDYIANLARSLSAGDYSDEILKIAKKHYGSRISLSQFDAQEMPFPDNSFDLIIIFEAIYYLPSAERFIRECRRVLRDGGKVLITTANKDLYDFNPSPFSYKYYGVMELKELLSEEGFNTEFFGYMNVGSVSLRQRILRPIKKIVVESGLMPKSMEAKKFLKRLVFGSLVKMPQEIKEGMISYEDPEKLSPSQQNRQHKVIYCVATIVK